MPKRKISLILFFETLVIGVISLFVGLLLGVILSQVMSLLVASMFEVTLTQFKFTFSSSAALKTLIYFSIMYIVVMIFNTIIVNKCKLIDLLHGSKKSEKIKLKNPLLCTIIFIISSLALSYAYYLVTEGFTKSNIMGTVNGILVPISLGAISTFLIFYSLSGLILKIVMHLKKHYYKGLNSFTIRQISSKINTTVFGMTTICLMLFLTICILSTALSLKNSLSNGVKELAPVDVQIKNTLNQSNKEQEQALKEILQKEELYNHLKDIVEINTYELDTITMKDTLQNNLEEITKDYPFLSYQDKETLIKLSDYNKLAKELNEKELTLKDNEYIILANYQMMEKIRNIALSNNQILTINSKEYHPKYKECQEGFIEISSNATNTGVIILPDEALEGNTPVEEILSANYKANTSKEKEKVDNIITAKLNNTYPELKFDTKLNIYNAGIGLGAMVTFLGLYLGIIFLISSAAILALKELSESTDNKERYNMLRKIGTDEKMINKALFNQIGVFFLFPLLLAVIHSIFGIKFANYILESMGTTSLLSSIILAAVFIVVIYGGYFLVTYYTSKNIIKERI